MGCARRGRGEFEAAAAVRARTFDRGDHPRPVGGGEMAPAAVAGDHVERLRSGARRRGDLRPGGFAGPGPAAQHDAPSTSAAAAVEEEVDAGRQTDQAEHAAHLAAGLGQDQHRPFAAEAFGGGEDGAEGVAVDHGQRAQVEQYAVGVGLGGVEHGLEVGVRGEVELTGQDEADRAAGFGPTARQEEGRWRVRPFRLRKRRGTDRYGSGHRGLLGLAYGSRSHAASSGSRAEDEQLDLEVGTDVGVGDEGEDLAAGEAFDRVDESLLHRLLEDAAGFLHQRRALELDHRLLDVAVDAAHDDREQIVLEQLRLGAGRDPVVVALVHRDHLLGHRGQ